MKQLIIASNNQGKIREIRAMINDLEVLSLKDIGYAQDIPEPFFTFEENAAQKANVIAVATGKNVFADDSGICVNALEGRPGVFSARYAGEGADDEMNLQKLLAELKGQKNRKAYYRAVICLLWEGEMHFFDGICNGRILEDKKGAGGFGYDPVFIPDGYEQTFAELLPEIKNKISHRGIAIHKMATFLQERV